MTDIFAPFAQFRTLIYPSDRGGVEVAEDYVYLSEVIKKIEQLPTLTSNMHNYLTRFEQDLYTYFARIRDHARETESKAVHTSPYQLHDVYTKMKRAQSIALGASTSDDREFVLGAYKQIEDFLNANLTFVTTASAIGEMIGQRGAFLDAIDTLVERAHAAHIEVERLGGTKLATTSVDYSTIYGHITSLWGCISSVKKVRFPPLYQLSSVNGNLVITVWNRAKDTIRSNGLMDTITRLLDMEQKIRPAGDPLVSPPPKRTRVEATTTDIPIGRNDPGMEPPWPFDRPTMPSEDEWKVVMDKRQAMGLSTASYPIPRLRPGIATLIGGRQFSDVVDAVLELIRRVAQLKASAASSAGSTPPGPPAAPSARSAPPRPVSASGPPAAPSAGSAPPATPAPKLAGVYVRGVVSGGGGTWAPVAPVTDVGCAYHRRDNYSVIKPDIFDVKTSDTPLTASGGISYQNGSNTEILGNYAVIYRPPERFFNYFVGRFYAYRELEQLPAAQQRAYCLLVLFRFHTHWLRVSALNAVLATTKSVDASPSIFPPISHIAPYISEHPGKMQIARKLLVSLFRKPGIVMNFVGKRKNVRADDWFNQVEAELNDELSSIGDTTTVASRDYTQMYESLRAAVILCRTVLPDQMRSKSGTVLV